MGWIGEFCELGDGGMGLVLLDELGWDGMGWDELEGMLRVVGFCVLCLGADALMQLVMGLASYRLLIRVRRWRSKAYR